MEALVCLLFSKKPFLSLLSNIIEKALPIAINKQENPEVLPNTYNTCRGQRERNKSTLK